MIIVNAAGFQLHHVAPRLAIKGSFAQYFP
jgi:hypothetical protein